MSRKIVLHKFPDLAIKNLSDFRKYRKPAVGVKELKFQWNQNMKVLEESSLSQKQIISTNIEPQKLDDLDFLKKQPHPVTSIMQNETEGKERTKECTLMSVFKGTLASHLRKRLLYSV